MGETEEDFSGLPPVRPGQWPVTDDDKERGRPYRNILLAGLVSVFAAFALVLIVFLAPAPYLNVTHSALQSSTGASPSTGCWPVGKAWVCDLQDKGNYRVKVDWAGCWTGKPVSITASTPGADREISGCVTVFNHLVGA